MKRKYFVSDSLEQLEKLEIDLERAGVKTEQIHILSENDAFMDTHHINAVSFIAKRDLVNSGLRGLLIGMAGAAVILLASWQLGISDYATWAPAIFLALAFLGFCTWEGGLWGLHKPNRDFARFENLLHEGKHVFFVDLRDDQEAVFKTIIADYPRLESAGSGRRTPFWALG